ncbi:FKBP-type peptidyl-prolyl cis-trans isomerase [Enterovibrio norvegicus]|uniref:Peptidyl-prolyl cis-trans isomerase n=1 Tax=Enterovibrio norvegicus TaxID=188144 RepID=A0A2N7L6Z9_9GAMM|nr:FKBP-type peptidyl-prolyl cis-trans isomerase [Enterovibrio norvegicus]PML80529.1 FKBP-type peptidyl-prolyl cis-trans isomerase FkpA [Enterovibrio norvegicus]PMN66139.1 FKBP-type peptidyl-prolyl cis-trans isomerase FkpA [Enterovibrio norvegicus]PMN89739.1 FKBP-type peptidyl-prolyl cis-trans isomerase FkpA [Enterovibrio norvegicus]
MKSVFKMSLLAATVALAVGCQQEEVKETKTAAVEAPAAVETVTFATEDDKAAYAIGASLAQYLKANLDQQEEIGLSLSSDLVLQGVQDAFADKSKLSDEEAQAALQSLDQRVAEMAQKQSEEKAAAAVKAGEDFRATFSKTEGVTTTDSGLMYQVETLGEGAKPAAEDTVVVHYKGTLTDGTQFDSSYDRNQPATFPLNRVIPGWTEGVQLMPVGSKFKFVIPPELAYGAQDTPAIPANSTLVFDVELIEIKGDAAKAETTQG